jgi:hypothetical protein
MTKYLRSEKRRKKFQVITFVACSLTIINVRIQLNCISNIYTRTNSLSGVLKSHCKKLQYRGLKQRQRTASSDNMDNYLFISSYKALNSVILYFSLEMILPFYMPLNSK